MRAEKTADLVAELKTERESLHRRVEQIDAVLTGLSALYPELVANEGQQVAAASATNGRSGPTGADRQRRSQGGSGIATKDVVEQILREQAGAAVSVEHLAQQAKGRGWGDGLDSPVGVIRTAARRLADSEYSSVQRERRDGRTWLYFIPMNAESPAADTAGLSDLSDDPGEEVIPDGNPAHRDLGPSSGGWLDRGHDHGAPVAG